MKTNFTRRDFLKASGRALASLCVLGLAGCDREQGGGQEQAEAVEGEAARLQASEGTTLRVMAWNIAEARMLSKSPTTQQDQTLGAIAARISAQAPDIVLLNECVIWWAGGNQVEDLAKLTRLQYYKWGRTAGMGIHTKAAGILSRYPLVDARVHLQPDTDSHTFGTLEATALVNGVAHRVFSTRIQGGTDNKEGHEHSARLIQGVDPGIPVIFGGDFNAHLPWPPFETFTKDSRLINAAVERPDPGICQDGYYLDGPPENGAIDHILYRGPYQVAQTKIRCDEPVPSDHPWVLVDLSRVDNAPLMGYRSLQSSNIPERYIRHQSSLGELTESVSSLDRRDATFRVIPGLADSRYVSFESANYPDYFLRHQDYRVKLHPRSDDQLFKADATFMPIAGLADAAATSLRSYNYPTRYLRHRGFNLWVEAGTDDLFRKDATYKVVPPVIASGPKRLVVDRRFTVRESDTVVDTGVNVGRGDECLFEATGSIWAGVVATGRNGPRGWNNIDHDPKFHLHEGEYAHPYSLIGRFGGLPYFYIGPGRAMQYPHAQARRLQLRINDDQPGNGDGEFSCRVQVWSNRRR